LSFKVPAPPSADSLDPAIMLWEAGVPIHRAHGKQFDPLSFNRKQGLDFRFSSLCVDGCPIGVLYGADSLMGAISETLLHTVPADGDRIKPRAISRASIEKYALSVVQPTRPLKLIDLTGHGLGRPGMPVTQGELILSNAAQYARTRAWAEAFYRHPVQADGFLWVSRQYNLARAMLLFEDRLGEGILALVAETAPAGRGLVIEQIEDAAKQARIAIVS
jgi:hypothetical protein